MSNYHFEIFILMGCALTAYTKCSTLTPKMHADFKGIMFCAHARTNPGILKQICIKGGQQEKIQGFDQTRFENLKCKEGNDGKVLLDPGNGTAWQLVQDALVVCEYYVTKNNHPTWAYGRGWHENDVFKYIWDPGRKGWIAEGNYALFLVRIIPRPVPKKITTRKKSDSDATNVAGTNNAVPGYRSSSSQPNSESNVPKTRFSTMKLYYDATLGR